MLPKISLQTPVSEWPLLIRLSDVARLAGCHPATVRRATQNEENPLEEPIRRHKNAAYFRREAVARWLGLSLPEPVAQVPARKPNRKARGPAHDQR
jgi:hypothetical protein